MEKFAMEILQAMLVDPETPRWSSCLMDRLFSESTGDTKSKVLQMLPLIDEYFSSKQYALTQTHVYFFREIQIRHFGVGDRTRFTANDLSWLIRRLLELPTPQRALMIAILTLPEELPAETSRLVKALLAGTPGEDYFDDIE